MRDPYLIPASYYDIASTGYRAAQSKAVAEFARGIDPAHGPVLDVGCGSGVTETWLLEAIPELSVLAVEPSPTMRALALSRLGTSPNWRARATVRPESGLTVPLPPSLSGAIMLGVLGHFSAEQRQALFTRVASRLPKGAPILFDLQLPYYPEPVPKTKFCDEQLGELRYLAYAEGSPVTQQQMRWVMSYETRDHDSVLERSTAEFVVYQPSPEQLAGELTQVGLNVATAGVAGFWLAS